MFKRHLHILFVNLILLLPVLYGAEIFLRVRLRVEPRDTYLRLGWRPLMPVWMGEVASLQDTTGTPFLGGIPGQNTYLCDDGYGAVIYKSDHLGFRSSLSDYQGGAPYEVAIVGDSFMHGWCHSRSLAEHLRAQNMRVVNTAIAGSHPYQYSAVIENIIARPVPPRNVIIGIYLGNDYGSCSGCLDRYSQQNPNLLSLYSYSKNLGMHVIRQDSSVSEYFSKLRSLQDYKTKSLIQESTWQILKLGEVRRFILGFIRPKRTEGVDNRSNIEVPINSTAVVESLSLLGRICSRSKGCNPILVTIPSNEAGENQMLRSRISTTHSKNVAKLQEKFPDILHVDLRKPPSAIYSCLKPLYDFPGRHLSASGQHCMNTWVHQEFLRSHP